MLKTILTADKVITIETTVTEHERIVDFDAIVDAMKVEPDDGDGRPIWEGCDGWNHEARGLDYRDHDGVREGRGYARLRGYDPNLLIEVDDDDIVTRWGCDGYPGASKQVRAELIAKVKRNSLDQLVKWYEDGWDWWLVGGEYKECSSYVGMVDDLDYAEELRFECASDIADQLEKEGFIVEGRYNPHARTHLESLRDRHDRRNQSYIMETR